MLKKMQSMADVFGTQNAPHLEHKQNVFFIRNWLTFKLVKQRNDPNICYQL